MKEQRKNKKQQHKNEPKGQQKQQPRGQQKEETKEIPKKVQIITWSVIGAVILGVLAVLIYLEFRPVPKEPELPDRLENVEHISSSIFEVMLEKKFSDELNEDDLEIWEKLESDLKYNVYVYIYNQDYEESPDSEALEDLVKSIYENENNTFTIVVLNYTKNQAILNLLTEYNVNLPTVPVLVHIEGETIAKEKGVVISYNDILARLNNLKGA